MFSVEHASSMGLAVMEEGKRGEGQQAFCLVAIYKHAVEFPRVLVRNIMSWS